MNRISGRQRGLLISVVALALSVIVIARVAKANCYVTGSATCATPIDCGCSPDCGIHIEAVPYSKCATPEGAGKRCCSDPTSVTCAIIKQCQDLGSQVPCPNDPDHDKCASFVDRAHPAHTTPANSQEAIGNPC
jgi:hypothetical protein